MNMDAILREVLKTKLPKTMDPSQIGWQQFCKSVIIFVGADTEVMKSGLIDAIQKDFAFMASTTVLIRVTTLPIGCSVEFDPTFDSEYLEHKQLPKLWRTGCMQRLYGSVEEYQEADDPGIRNAKGDVFYQKDRVSRADVEQMRSMKKTANGQCLNINVAGNTAIVPVMEIIDAFAPPDKMSFDICERFYEN